MLSLYMGLDATSSIEVTTAIASSTGSLITGVTPIFYLALGLFIVIFGFSFFYKFIKYIFR